MPRILYWNINRKDLSEAVCKMADTNEADVVVVIESPLTKETMLSHLQEGVSRDFQAPESIPGRFHLFSRKGDLDLTEIHYGDRYSFRNLILGSEELSLCCFHLVDQRNHDSEHRQSELEKHADIISQHEEDRQHRRTLLLGDFNVNAFEKMMNLPRALNSVMSKRCAEKQTRRYQNVDYPFFYNPMWSLLGDGTEGPAGTYYQTQSGHGYFGWNMLDQLILRIDAINHFERVQIIDSAAGESLLTESGVPNRTRYSDHLPLLITLK